ncbi:MAG: hypothetical protein A6D92_07220, partial [Symbiobacterium thermophilum]
ARIQALEKELGQQLFERRPRGVRLTDAGRALLPHAERVLQDIKRARQAVLDLQTASGGTLSVGSALTTSAYLLPDILLRFKRGYPNVEVLVHTGRSHQVQQLVLDDTVQVGLVHAPLPSHAEIVSYPLSEEPILLVVPPDHPVARHSEVTLDELTQESFITTDRASGYWALVEQWWASQGFVPHITMELDSIEAAKRMVLCGLGLTMLPYSTVKSEIELSQVVAVPLANSATLNGRTFSSTGGARSGAAPPRLSCACWRRCSRSTWA